jgi:hypothetical protein
MTRIVPQKGDKKSHGCEVFFTLFLILIPDIRNQLDGFYKTGKEKVGITIPAISK